MSKFTELFSKAQKLLAKDQYIKAAQELDKALKQRPTPEQKKNVYLRRIECHFAVNAYQAVLDDVTTIRSLMTLPIDLTPEAFQALTPEKKCLWLELLSIQADAQFGHGDLDFAKDTINLAEPYMQYMPQTPVALGYVQQAVLTLDLIVQEQENREFLETAVHELDNVQDYLMYCNISERVGNSGLGLEACKRWCTKFPDTVSGDTYYYIATFACNEGILLKDIQWACDFLDKQNFAVIEPASARHDTIAHHAMLQLKLGDTHKAYARISPLAKIKHFQAKTILFDIYIKEGLLARAATIIRELKQISRRSGLARQQLPRMEAAFKEKTRDISFKHQKHLDVYEAIQLFINQYQLQYKILRSKNEVSLELTAEKTSKDSQKLFRVCVKDLLSSFVSGYNLGKKLQGKLGKTFNYSAKPLKLTINLFEKNIGFLWGTLEQNPLQLNFPPKKAKVLKKPKTQQADKQELVLKQPKEKPRIKEQEVTGLAKKLKNISKQFKVVYDELNDIFIMDFSLKPAGANFIFKTNKTRAEIAKHAFMEKLHSRKLPHGYELHTTDHGFRITISATAQCDIKQWQKQLCQPLIDFIAPYRKLITTASPPKKVAPVNPLDNQPGTQPLPAALTLEFDIRHLFNKISCSDLPTNWYQETTSHSGKYPKLILNKKASFTYDARCITAQNLFEFFKHPLFEGYIAHYINKEGITLSILDAQLPEALIREAQAQWLAFISEQPELDSFLKCQILQPLPQKQQAQSPTDKASAITASCRYFLGLLQNSDLILSQAATLTELRKLDKRIGQSDSSELREMRTRAFTYHIMRLLNRIYESGDKAELPIAFLQCRHRLRHYNFSRNYEMIHQVFSEIYPCFTIGKQNQIQQVAALLTNLSVASSRIGEPSTSESITIPNGKDVQPHPFTRFAAKMQRVDEGYQCFREEYRQCGFFGDMKTISNNMGHSPKSFETMRDIHREVLTTCVLNG